MDKKTFVATVKQSSSDSVVDAVRAMDADTRSSRVADALALYRQVDRFYGGADGRAKDPRMLDPDAAVAALYAVATWQDLKALRALPVPVFAPIADLMARVRPDWVQQAVDHFVRPELVGTLEGLWRDGLCRVPEGDAVVLAYFDVLQSNGLSEDVLLGGLVWRFFDTDGTARFGLPTHDRLARERRSVGLTDRSAPWSERLLGYAAEGRLDRDRLLDASLGAVRTLTRPADRGWCAAFHEALGPVPEEIAARRGAYQALATGGTAAQRAFAKRCLRQA